MMQKDYLLRVYSQFARALARIAILKEERDYDAVLSLYDELYKQVLGTGGAGFVNALSDDTLLSLLAPISQLDVEKTLVIAMLQKGEGETYTEMKNNTESYYRYLRSLNLYLEVMLANPEMNDSELFESIEMLTTKLTPYELPLKTQQRLFDFFVRTHQYRNAHIFLQAQVPEPTLLNQGINFYTQLLQSPTDALSSEEVHQSLQQLRSLQHPLR